jgi:hypothetical protein
MRVENWNPNAMDKTFEDITMSRLIDASYVVKDEAARQLRGHIGSGKTTGINRPIYKTGPYAGVEWTKRNFGELLQSVRVVRDKTPSGKAFSKKRNVRIYAGHFLAYYADIFEYTKPFMRTALDATLSRVKSIIGAE